MNRSSESYTEIRRKRKMKLRKLNSKPRRGFSLIEVIAAVVILAVVATATVATISPMREKSRSKIDQQSIAKLNGIVQAYYMEYGTYPDRNMTILQTRGYASTRLHSTPYGGYYQWDTARLTVVNPNAPAPTR
jgi:prepilin-type N-terminal cleavage/methylation domain-containing protein